MREKDEWRFATMECGGQCVLMDGVKQQKDLSVISLDMHMTMEVRKCINYNILNHLLFSFTSFVM